MTIRIRNNGTDENHPNYCVNIEEDISYSPEQKEIVICSHCYFQVINVRRNPQKIDYLYLDCLGFPLDN